MGLALVSAASVVAAIETQHYIAAPFAALFMVGYAYVATLVIQEQFLQRSSIVPASGTVDSDTGMASAA